MNKEDVTEDVNMEKISFQDSYLLRELSTKLDILLDQQSIRVNNRIKSVENQIVGIEEDLSSVAQETAALEDEVETVKLKKEDKFSFLQPPSGPSAYIADLCGNVSLPGLRYIAKGPRVLGFVWIFLQLVALLISATYIQHAYYRWKSSPVVQSVKNTLTNVHEIPFPAVTICEHISLKEEYNQWEILTRCLSVENRTTWECSDQELDMFLISHQVDPVTFFHLSDSDRVLYEESLTHLREQLNRTISGEEYHRYVDNIGESYTKWNCSPKNNASLCAGSRSPVMLIPQEIILLGKHMWYLHKCRTYNGANLGAYYKDFTEVNHDSFVEKGSKNIPYCDWTLENMLKPSCRKGYNIVYTSENVQFSTDRSDKTFFVVIHNPADTPNLVHMKPFGIRRHKLFKMKISPQLVTASNDLSNVEILNRGCVFSYEMSLTLFKFYTYQNCYLECQINCALSTCGCVPFSISVLNSSIRICVRKCQIHVCECDCPPDCVSLSYDVDMEVEKYYFSTVKVEYKNLEFPSAFRYSVTNPAEFVAYSLGILSVFNGFSAMLVCEILYWLTLRVWCTVKRTLTPITPEN